MVLYHEAIDYLREMQRRRDRELSSSDLPQMEMDKLCVVDHYPSDRLTFSSHGYDLHIENELVTDAFTGLSVQEQSILILHFALDLPDQEVGRLAGMSRSAVQRRMANTPRAADQVGRTHAEGRLKPRKNPLTKQSARKAVNQRNLRITASVRQDWKTNKHTAFGFDWMPLVVFVAKRLDFSPCMTRVAKRVK